MVCPLHWSGVFGLYRIPLRGLFSVYGALSTSLLRSSAFIGCVSLSVFQIRSFNISSHSWRWTELLPVLLHLSRRHAVTTTTAFVRLWSLARTDHSSIHSRQSHIHRALPAPRYRTTCRLTSQLRRHSPSSDSALRHFCSRVHTLTLSL